MNKLKKYNEFINEGLLQNLKDKIEILFNSFKKNKNDDFFVDRIINIININIDLDKMSSKRIHLIETDDDIRLTFYIGKNNKDAYIDIIFYKKTQNTNSYKGSENYRFKIKYDKNEENQFNEIIVIKMKNNKKLYDFFFQKYKKIKDIEMEKDIDKNKKRLKSSSQKKFIKKETDLLKDIFDYLSNDIISSYGLDNDNDDNKIYLTVKINNIDFVYGIIKEVDYNISTDYFYTIFFMDDTLEYVGNEDIYPKMQDYLYSTNVSIFPIIGEDIILNSLTKDEDIEKIKSRFKTIKEKYDNEIKPYENKLKAIKKFNL